MDRVPLDLLLMLRHLLLFVALVALASALSACAATGPAGPVDARAVYAKRCALCHPAWHPREYTPTQWPALVRKYAPRAGLSHAEREAVTDWLVEASAR